MAIYNVKIVDEKGGSVTQPIGASSDNVIIKNENISLTQKLLNINADNNNLSDQIKKVESRHFTINKHIDSTNYFTDDGYYKIAKLPDGKTFTLGTEWLINVNENITIVGEMEDGGEASYTIATTSKILFKDGKFTLISFDNKIDLPDELREQVGTPPDYYKEYYLRTIKHDNNSIYLYGTPYSNLFKYCPLSFVDIGVTFLELSNAQDCFLEEVNFEFIPESEFEFNILSYQELDSLYIETDTKTSFTINISAEDEILESGWYKVAYYDFGAPCGECILSLQSYTKETGTQINSFLLTIYGYSEIAKITPISQILEEDINIDQIQVVMAEERVRYILIHLNLGEYESYQSWDCCVTIHNLNYTQYIYDDGIDETNLWVAPKEPFSKITEDEIDYVYTSYNITNDSLIYPLTNIDGGGAGNSNHQFTVYSSNITSAGWYRVAKISGSVPHAEAMVHIADETTNNTRFLSDIMCILDPLSSSFKTLTCNIPDYYAGFNEIRYTYVDDENMVYLELYYNWDTNNSPSVTVENINPINIDGEIVQWEPVNFEIANGSTQVIADYRLELSNNIQIATTKDLEELGGGGVNDETLEEVLNEANSYTDTKVAEALAEAKAYADSLVNGLINGNS